LIQLICGPLWMDEMSVYGEKLQIWRISCRQKPTEWGWQHRYRLN